MRAVIPLGESCIDIIASEFVISAFAEGGG